MVVNINFLTSEDVLPEKRLLEKTATIKIFEYSPLGSKLKRQLLLQRSIQVFEGSNKY